MPDPIFDHPRLASVYDPLDPDRSDLDTYVDLVDEFSAHAVFDIGCGTGTLCVRLAERDLRVVDIVGEGPVESWVEVTAVDGEFVTFESPTLFHADGERLESASTLRFRTEAALRWSLSEAGFVDIEVRDLPYAPTRGWLFIARA